MTFQAVFNKYRFISNIKIIYFDINKERIWEFWFRRRGWFQNQLYKYPPNCICFNYFFVEQYGEKLLVCQCYHPSIDSAALNEKEQQEYCDAVSLSAWNELEAYNQSFGQQYNMFGGMD